MEKKENDKNRFGLLGKNISYSFSKNYFTKKFSDLQLAQNSYENFDLAEIGEFRQLLKENQDLKGLNVTIPYKESVLPYLDAIDPMAAKIGAVNTIKFTAQGLVGHNTDAHGFRESIVPLLGPHHRNALILGTGGASKAIAHVLTSLGIGFTYVSRKPQESRMGYSDIDKEVMESHSVIINCTPVGTYPNITEKPDLPYHYLHGGHLLYDLIYNPERTAFLKEGEAVGATVQNGLDMLVLQAEKAWEIWNS